MLREDVLGVELFVWGKVVSSSTSCSFWRLTHVKMRLSLLNEFALVISHPRL